ncbi:MAG: DUF2142 domain-containing protein [Myxococcales bacterium]|nr:DUF2142 domain-containing protein [Myxococcales bacterium]
MISPWSKTLLLLGGLLGLLYVVLTPPFQAPDEQTHFFRAYQVAAGQLVAIKHGQRSGGVLPESLLATVQASRLYEIQFHPDKTLSWRETHALFSIPLQPQITRFVEFPNVVPYSPILYLPQSIGIFIGKSLNAPPIVLMYIGRLANLLASLCLFALAIHLTPICQAVFFLVVLMPICLFQIASLSADGMTFGITLLFVGIVLNLAYAPAPLPQRMRTWVLSLVAVALSLVKTAYLPMLLLFLLLPTQIFGSKWRHARMAALLAGLSLLAGGLWSSAVQRVYVPETWNGGNPPGQLQFILQHPVAFVGVLFRDVFLRKYLGYADYSRTFTYPDSYIGQLGVLGWVDAPLPGPAMDLWWLFLLALACTTRRTDITIPRLGKLCIAGTVLLTTTATLSLLYVCCSPPGANFIIGQGRHILPIVPLLLLLPYDTALTHWIHRKYPTLDIKTEKLAIPVALAINLAAFYAIKTRYYG